MIIAIDGNEANVEKKVGISEYAFELLSEFKKNKISNIRFLIYLKTAPRPELPEEDKNWNYRIVKPSKAWTQFGLPFDLYFKKPRPDVFFSPTHYAPRFSPVPTVVSIMDLAFLHYSELFRKEDLYKLVNWTKYSVFRAKRVLTISNASKNDIIKTYQIPEEKVVVTYPGLRLMHTMDDSKILKKYGVHKPYILFVGTLQPRKNIARLIEAFSKILPKHDNLNLVIVGKKGWLYEEILQAPQQFGVEKQVLFLEFVPDTDLSELYKNALCFVLPSLYEGFGLPILEAMHYGCPVITSNVSSLPEAGGDAAIYVDPLSANDIAAKLVSVVSNRTLRDEMIKKGREQVKKFSWEKTAKETLSVLTHIGGAR